MINPKNPLQKCSKGIARQIPIPDESSDEEFDRLWVLRVEAHKAKWLRVHNIPNGGIDGIERKPVKKEKGQRGVRKYPNGHIENFKNEILERIERGETLASIVRTTENIPAYSVIMGHLKKDEEFKRRYDEAREIGYEMIAQSCMALADDPGKSLRTINNEKGETIVTEEAVARARLQIETRLKLLAAWYPARYGNKTTVVGDGENPIEVIHKAIVLGSEEIRARMKVIDG